MRKLVAVLAFAVVLAAACSGGGSESGSASTTSTTAATGTTGTRGVTDTAITVVFPVIDLAAVGAASGFTGSDEKYDDGITAFVDAINEAGGINGRTIDARIEKFNPLDDADMRAKCKDWTENEQVFAVIDAGAWHDDNQLCITQEGHVPLISSWTTVTDWTERGKPYLWWTGPDQADILRTVVQGGLDQGLLAPGEKFAILAGDRESDKLALDSYLVPALEAKGLHAATVEQLSSSTADSATRQAQAPGIVQRLKEQGIDTVIPLLPFNAFTTYLRVAQEQEYKPRYVLSDYESSISVGLGLAEFQYKDVLDGQIGFTAQTLGVSDDERGYDAGAAACFETWKRSHDVPPYLEAQGPIMTECQNIGVFAEAVRRAGRDLTVDGFDEAMASITSFDATVVPDLGFGPDDHAGPHQYRTVSIHVNDEADNRCPLKADGGAQGSCWLVIEDFQEMPAK